MNNKPFLQTRVLVYFIMLFSIKLAAQNNFGPYDDRSYLIQFDDDATEAEINQVMSDMESVEIWVSPLTQTRKWKMIDDIEFPYYNEVLDAEILDINEQRDGAGGRAKVNDVDLNFFYSIDPTNSNNSGGAQNYCYEMINQTAKEENTVTVCILDTGFGGSQHGVVPTQGWNYIDDSDELTDDHGHGSHIFSIVEDTYFQNTGLDPNTINWDIRKTHNDEGYAELSNIILALEEAVVEGADIINMSTSYYDNEDIEKQLLVQGVIEVIESNGALLIVSAGNEESELDLGHVPNCFPSEFQVYNLLTVGAFNCDEQSLSEFSNYGIQSIDITAPGNNILGYELKDGSPVYKSGTSQATAIVTGVAASLAQNQDFFDYIEIKCAILSGATYESSLEGDILTSGFINAYRALDFLNQGCTDIIDSPEGNFSKKRSEVDTEEHSFDLFPNPANEYISLELDHEVSKCSALIIDTKGQIVDEKTFMDVKSMQFNIQDLEKGIYVLQLKTDENFCFKTFVKQ